MAKRVNSWLDPKAFDCKIVKRGGATRVELRLGVVGGSYTLNEEEKTSKLKFCEQLLALLEELRDTIKERVIEGDE